MSQYPAVERLFRDIMESWLLIDHDTDGEHTQITLPELAGDPATATNTGFVYTKDDAGDTELFYRDDSGNVVQFTKDGGINAVSNPLTSVLDTGGFSIDESEGTAVASAATTNIWVTDGNNPHVTGSVTITSFGTAPRVGAVRWVTFDGAPLLTNSGNLNLQGGANIQIAAGDIARVYADTTTQFDVIVFKADGTAVVGTPQATQVAIEAETDEDTYIPPDLLKHSPGVAKAWVKFQVNGTIDASYNIDSVVKNSTGDWTITITNNFSSANYVAVVVAFDTTANDRDGQVDAMAAGTLGVICTGAGVKADPDTGMLVVMYGDQ